MKLFNLLVLESIIFFRRDNTMLSAELFSNQFPLCKTVCLRSHERGGERGSHRWCYRCSAWLLQPFNASFFALRCCEWRLLGFGICSFLAVCLLCYSCSDSLVLIQSFSTAHWYYTRWRLFHFPFQHISALPAYIEGLPFRFAAHPLHGYAENGKVVQEITTSRWLSVLLTGKTSGSSLCSFPRRCQPVLPTSWIVPKVDHQRVTTHRSQVTWPSRQPQSQQHERAVLFQVKFDMSLGIDKVLGPFSVKNWSFKSYSKLVNSRLQTNEWYFIFMPVRHGVQFKGGQRCFCYFCVSCVHFYLL